MCVINFYSYLNRKHSYNKIFTTAFNVILSLPRAIFLLQSTTWLYIDIRIGVLGISDVLPDVYQLHAVSRTHQG